MRTPNTSCILCGKLLYRRPSELQRFRYAACMKCRAKAQSVTGVTEAQQAGLKLGRPKGHKRRLGYVHGEESKLKITMSNRAFWADNPEKAKERGEKHRGENAYNWKGGITDINKSIRNMNENRLWMKAVKDRDGACVRCGSTENLESHHIKPLGQMISELGIRSNDDARLNAKILWDIANGETLCGTCHYTEHGRQVLIGEVIFIDDIGPIEGMEI